MEPRSEKYETQLQRLREPPPASLLHDPIEYLYADHFRQRTLCDVVEILAKSEHVDQDLADAIVTFLTKDFERHIRDEEEDLFPLLKSQVDRESNFSEVLHQLDQQHDEHRSMVHRIIEGLSSPAKTISNQDLQKFADSERQHLTLENAIVLPIAKTRLSKIHLVDLAEKMAQRRGLKLKDIDHAG